MDDVTYIISPVWKGHVTVRDLIQPLGTATLFVEPTSLVNLDGILFQIKTKDYHFEVGVNGNNFYIIRNLQSIQFPFVKENQTIDVMFEAQWKPDELSLVVLDSDFFKKIKDKSEDEGTIELVKIKKILKTTPPIHPPNSLIRWAREQDFLPKKQYSSEQEFFQEVNTAIQSVQDKIKEFKMYDGFWNIIRKSKKTSRTPKKEPQNQPTIGGLLSYVTSPKNINIAPEHPTGGGNLDFLLSGVNTKNESLNACIEIKNAHSKDIEKGITTQLPEYMKTKGTDLGIYLVLWFKGKHFDEPKKYSELKELETELYEIRDAKGLNHIRLHIIDLSGPKPPSTL